MRYWLMAWALALVFLMAFAAQPVGLNAQMAFAGAGLGVMALIRVLKLPGAFDHVFMAIAAAIFFRYLAWRVTETLPSPDQPLDLAVGLMLLVAEIYAIGMLALNFFVVSDPIRRADVEPDGPREAWPTVDVFVPSFDEDIDIVGTTLAAARNMDYPQDRFRVWLLDDGATTAKREQSDPAKARAARERGEAMRAYCEDLGVGYLARSRNDRAKAGNMNAALPETTGELVAILDADHAPTPDFLHRTVGHFQRDARLFLVQTPHYFLNADPVERNLGLKAMPAESEMFYSVIQRGLDKWNAAFFCGSAAVLRRAALDEAGGFSGETVTEDCETALRLHRSGWRSAYVDRAMVGGLQPETFAAWIGQRTRWAQGMTQLAVLNNPAVASGLSVPQRLAYLSSSLFWLFPFPRLAFMLAPASFLLLDMHVYDASPREIVAFTLASLFAGVLVQARLYGRVRWPWMSEVYEFVQSPHLARAVTGVFLKPRAPSFNVTAKGETVEDDRLSGAGRPVVALFVVLLVTAIAGIVQTAATRGAETLLALVTAWAVFNLAIATLGLGVVAERRERRRHPRVALTGEAALELGGDTLPVTLNDGSIGGLRVTADGADLPAALRAAGTVPLDAVLRLADADAALPVRVTPVGTAGTGGTRALGVAFGTLDAAQRRAVAALLFPTSDTVDAQRRARHGERGATLGTLALLGRAPLHAGRAGRLIALDAISAMRERLARRRGTAAASITTPVAGAKA